MNHAVHYIATGDRVKSGSAIGGSVRSDSVRSDSATSDSLKLVLSKTMFGGEARLYQAIC